jgi:hypothetical protein
MHGALCTFQERTGFRTEPVDAAATDPLLAWLASA